MSDQGNVENLLRVYEIASPTQVHEGRQWYYDAHDWCGRLAKRYDLPLAVIADVAATLSPRNRWDKNMEDTVTVIKAWQADYRDVPALGCHTFHNCVWRAFGILDGEYSPDSPKVTSFATNIKEPHAHTDVVTVDVWAYRAWLYNSVAKVINFPEKIYNKVREDYLVGAEITGELPAHFQAIVWLVVRKAGTSKKRCGLEQMRLQQVFNI